ncbi:C40 family peptidase [Clostridium sp. SHJSY1]|uniref:C40 family peptidase n=1 Tax=Clostridium sp. SHJSY1 TaxID=2942483 RepID=UPI002875EF7B|nr:C40 family peptidase [Clostridium sp. SHJSY1]MDS0525168.1 C40 family peptidase [Clostridium sp. SHJSY1]
MKKRNITVVLCALLIVQAIPFTQASAATESKAQALSTVETVAQYTNKDLQSSNFETLSKGSSKSLTLSEKRQAVVKEAKKYLGKPYKYGASGPNAFDCSGLTSYVYKKALGINITRTTSTQVNQGIAVSKKDLQPGDLVFPHSGHVQIYIGNGQVIHAPHTGDVVKIAKLGTVWKARRIIH